MGDPFLIIDAHPANLANDDHGGLLHAGGYYARFPEEPSPLGTMKLTAARTSLLAVTTLELVLTEMLKAGAGGTVLLVCHAWESGLLLQIVAESKKMSVLTMLEGIEQITARLAEGEPIRNRAVADGDGKGQQKKADDLAAFVSRQGFAITGVVTLAEAITAYESWRSGQLTGRLGITAPDPLAVFRRLEKKIAAVRALKLERVEMRACEIGTNKPSMAATKRLFGCQKLVAPKQIMFFVSNFSIFASRDRLAAELKPLAVQIDKETPQRAVAGQPTYAHTWDTADVLATAEAREFKVGTGAGATFTLWIGEQQNDPFVFNARGVTAPDPRTRAVNFATVTAFVKQAIFPGTAAISGQFPLCGMFLRPRRFLMPREADYLSNLVQE